MNEYDLGQTLIVSPEASFDRIASVIESGGWTRDRRRALPSLIKGDPETASWSLRGQKPFVVYTFNPVARLRVLDVATVPPVFRGMIAKRLPLLDTNDFFSLLSTPTSRDRLLGLWAAQETERYELASETAGLRNDPDRTVAEAARQVTSRLRDLGTARLAAMASLRLLADAGESVIRRLGDADFVRGLRPTRDDCARLFDAELVDSVAAAVERVDYDVPLASPGDTYPDLQVTAATAGLLRWPNDLSHHFPLGYRNSAGWMTPDRVWLAWIFKSAQGGGVRYDGLAWLDDRWVWIPKAYRVLARLGQAANEDRPGASVS